MKTSVALASVALRLMKQQGNTRERGAVRSDTRRCQGPPQSPSTTSVPRLLPYLVGATGCCEMMRLVNH
eukprot:1186023-Prorocentrum_minimum.AAC.3